MADDLITFDDNIARDIMKMRDEWRRRGTASKRTRRQPIMIENLRGEDLTGGGGTGGGGCCCEETRCLGTRYIVTSYEFRVPNFRCRCDPASDAGSKVSLLPTDDSDIWESDPIQCLGNPVGPCTNVATWTWREACTNTGTWTWTVGDCTNTVTWRWHAETSSGCTHAGCHWLFWNGAWLLISSDCTTDCSSGGSSCCGYPAIAGTQGLNYFVGCDCEESAGGYWEPISQTDSSCCMPDPPDFNGTVDGQEADTECTVPGAARWVLTSETDSGCCTPDEPDFDGTIPDETTTTECEVLEGWVLTSQTDEDCCTPDEPDFDGSVDGQTAETECNLADGEGSLVDSFWRLTKGTNSYYGSECDNSKLEFIVSDETIYTYYLACPTGPATSRRFCAKCVNTFHIVTCGATDCEVPPPAVICLEPAGEYQGPRLFVGRRPADGEIGSLRVITYDTDGHELNWHWWHEEDTDNPTGLRSIATDPNTGNVYVATYDQPGTIFAIDSAGAELWSVSIHPDDVNAVAVDQDGNVYWGGETGTIHKYDGTTGVEITAGGWPYTPSGTLFVVTAICVDQSGNVYVGGGRLGGVAGTNCLAFDTSGTLLWAATLGDAGDTPANYNYIGSIAINVANDELSVLKAATATQHSEFIVDPADGSFTGIAGFLTGGVATCYDKDGNRFTAHGANIYKNASLFYTLPGTGSPAVLGMTCERDTGKLYVVQNKPNAGDRPSIICLASDATLLWQFDPNAIHYSGSAQAQAIEHSDGRLGAFGV